MPAGNINQFILKMSSYATSLARTRGLIAEFVNPKYKDASKTTFKSSTRLECMMQDYPKALGSSAAIGFTVVNQVGQLSPGRTCTCCRLLQDLVGQLCRHRLKSSLKSSQSLRCSLEFSHGLHRQCAGTN